MELKLDPNCKGTGCCCWALDCSYYSCVLNKRAGTLIFRWFNFPPAHTLLFSTCTIIGNYIHTYKANIANIQTARLFGPARSLGTQE